MELDGMSRREVIEKELKALSVEGRQFEKETLAGSWFDSPIQIETLKAISAGHQRLNSASGDAVSEDGQESTATLILHPEAPLPISVLLGRRSVAQKMDREGLLKLCDRLRLFFGCERRGALGLARNL